MPTGCFSNRESFRKNIKPNYFLASREKSDRFFKQSDFLEERILLQLKSTKRKRLFFRLRGLTFNTRKCFKRGGGFTTFQLILTFR
jgi:hypothetical protein